MNFGRGGVTREHSTQGWLSSFPWASILLFFVGALFLLTTTYLRGRDGRNEALSELLAEVRVRAANLEGVLFRLARELGCVRQTIYNHLGELEDRGLVKRVDGQGVQVLDRE